MSTETSIGKTFSFPTRLLTGSGSTKQFSTSRAALSTRLQVPSVVKNLGHDVLARSARTPVLSAMSALNASAQRGQDDMRGSAGRARIEAHYPVKHSADELELARSWRAALATGFQASGTGGAPVPRARNRQNSCDSHLCGAIRRTAIRPCQLPSASSRHLTRLL